MGQGWGGHWQQDSPLPCPECTHSTWNDAASLLLPPSWDPADPYPPSPPRNAPRTWSRTHGRWYTSPEQEEEEVGRLPVHGWVSQASGDFVCGEQWGLMDFRALLWTQHCDGFGGLEAADSLQATHGLLVGATGLTR